MAAFNLTYAATKDLFGTLRYPVSTDAWGHIQDENFGNGVATFTAFDPASGLMSYGEGGLRGGSMKLRFAFSGVLASSASQGQAPRQANCQ